MVNVGGRSKGCSNCRRRRVKCDETRPTCLRCQRAGLECDGPRDITFIEGTIVRSRRGSNSLTGSEEQNTDLVNHEIPQFNSHGSNQMELYISYALKHLRRDGMIELAARTIKQTDITPTSVATFNGRISHHAVLCFATIFFGAQHRQAHISRQGYLLHGVVLRRLNQALSDPACNTDDDLIYSVITLSIMELASPTGPENHVKHIAGLEQLLSLREYGRSISVESATLYRGLQQMILFAALHSRRASILAQPEWKKRLRTHCDSEKGLQRQHLIDVLADCTVLIATRDNLLRNWESYGAQSASQLENIKQDTLILLPQLSAWREQWESHPENSYLEVSITDAGLGPIQELCGDDTMPFESVFEFQNSASVVELMLYNIALIYVLQILAVLDFDSPDNQAERESATRNFLRDPSYMDDMWGQTENPHLLAQRVPVMEICRSIPYYIDKVARLNPSAIAQWAIGTGLLKLREDKSVVGRWVLELLQQRSPLVAKTLKIMARDG